MARGNSIAQRVNRTPGSRRSRGQVANRRSAARNIFRKKSTGGAGG